VHAGSVLVRVLPERRRVVVGLVDLDDNPRSAASITANFRP